MDRSNVISSGSEFPGGLFNIQFKALEQAKEFHDRLGTVSPLYLWEFKNSVGINPNSKKKFEQAALQRKNAGSSPKTETANTNLEQKPSITFN